MKKTLMVLFVLATFLGTTMAQNVLNTKADNIVGIYQSKQGDDSFKASITKLPDGTYRGQVIWLENDRDANGNKRVDEKNPDKSLRNVPCDQIVLFSGLEYNAKQKRWDGAKIYDPQRGLKANLRAEFIDNGQLKIRGSILGISESVYWDKIQ